jgi:pectate lyase
MRNGQASVAFLAGLLTISSSLVAAPAQITTGAAVREKAFPGAEGFGAYAKGGRGGSVIHVTNLDDAGPGSLRSAVEAKGPRIVRFWVAGLIELKSELRVTEPYLTIEGQSAPDNGVCLKYYGLEVLETHDVIIRYLRVRVGDKSGVMQDAISAGNSRDVIFDHCSASWGTDETLSIRRCENLTVQWCIISEGLHDSIHEKGAHGFGSLIDGDRISFHHNLYAHFDARTPRPGSVLLDFRNNVVYDWGSYSGYNWDDKLRMNYVGNYLKAGRSTKPEVREEAYRVVKGQDTRIFAQGNVMEGSKSKTGDNWLMILHKPVHRVDKPFEVEPVRTHSAKEAYRLVLESAGASLPTRDTVDLRVVDGVRNGTGGIIDSQRDVGGRTPRYSSFPAP